MVVSLLSQQKQLLEYFFQNVDASELEKLAEFASCCAGSLFLTGVGKSGAIARKLASTFVSTGTASLYLSPQDALHGDIGNVRARDAVLFLSKSGESEELLNLLPHLKKREVALAALVSAPESRLARAVDLAVFLPLLKEMGPHELIPTTSCALQLIAGDVIALRAMEKCGTSLEQFALNHPSGQLGRRLSLRVRDLMLTGSQIPLVDPGQTLKIALFELTRKRCGCLVVANRARQLLGIFTDGDLRRLLQNRGTGALEHSLEQVMNRNPKVIDADASAYRALQEMENSGPIAEVPVLEESKLIGLLKMHDLVRWGL